MRGAISEIFGLVNTLCENRLDLSSVLLKIIQGVVVVVVVVAVLFLCWFIILDPLKYYSFEDVRPFPFLCEKLLGLFQGLLACLILC